MKPELPLLTIPNLLKHRAMMVEYVKAKTDAEDWHGVSDAANDLREIEVALTLLKKLAP